MSVSTSYVPTIIAQIRFQPPTWAWILQKSTQAGIKPSTWIRRKMEDMAKNDLIKEDQDEATVG